MTGGQGVHQGERAVFQRPVGGRRPLRRRRRPSSASGVSRTTSSEQEPVGQASISSASSRPPDMAQRCSTTSASVKRAEREHKPGLWVDQGGGQLLASWAARAPARPSTPPVQVGPDGQAYLGGLGLPAAGQQARGERVVLGRPGGKRGLVVGLHPQRRRLVERALGFQLGLDLGACAWRTPAAGRG